MATTSLSGIVKVQVALSSVQFKSIDKEALAQFEKSHHLNSYFSASSIPSFTVGATKVIVSQYFLHH
jgi:hypothetical protein